MAARRTDGERLAPEIDVPVAGADEETVSEKDHIPAGGGIDRSLNRGKVSCSVRLDHPRRCLCGRGQEQNAESDASDRREFLNRVILL